MWIFKVGVVGAGAMGGGIGQVVTYAGLPVVVKDIDQGQLDAGPQARGGHLPEPRGQGQDDGRPDAGEAGPRSSTRWTMTTLPTWTSSSRPCRR